MILPRANSSESCPFVVIRKVVRGDRSEAAECNLCAQRSDQAILQWPTSYIHIYIHVHNLKITYIYIHIYMCQIKVLCAKQGPAVRLLVKYK